MHQENNDLRAKLKEAEVNLKALNENLQRMQDMDIVAMTTTQSYADSMETKQQQKQQEEKRQLKKDAKELCNINDRLRNKLKELTKSYDQLKAETTTKKGESSQQLHDQLQKARNTIRELEEDMKSRQRVFEKEKSALECRVEEQVNRCHEVSILFLFFVFFLQIFSICDWRGLFNFTQCTSSNYYFSSAVAFFQIDSNFWFCLITKILSCLPIIICLLIIIY